jgi:uncharacterized protein
MSADMGTATIRCYAELNDFLPLGRRQVSFLQPFQGRPAVKDLLEAAGIPHTEVDLILAGGESVGFDYPVCEGDRLSVYPVFESFEISSITRVRPEPLRETRFVLDVHLGKLARMLRLLGFDASYDPAATDEWLADNSSAEGRILLTRDRGLLKRSVVTHGYCVRATEARVQTSEVVARFHLSGSARPFTRCLCCNDLLEQVEKTQVEHLLPPRVRAAREAFRRCPGCGRVYWQGSHYPALQSLVDEALGA